MGFLIDPNISYVLLVFGFLVAVLALFSPGTGILELIALAVLAMAGYGMVNLRFHWWALLIMVLGFIPFIVSFRRAQKFRIPMLGLAALAFIIGSAFLFESQQGRPAVNIWLIFFLSPIVVGLTWLITSKSLEAVTARPTFNPDLLVGMTGHANNDIRGQGSVHVNGEDWTATSKQFIPAGAHVRVLHRNGLMLEVERAEPPIP
jgi:membrane-bound serine protease (ClpP class)